MSTMVPMYGFGGGSGGAGASLTVNAPAGCTVTVSKDGKTKTKTAGADGVAVFKGLSSGEWTVTISDGEQAAQKTVTITADYSAAITFFAAIHVTYPAGSTCTATDGTTTLTALDTSGTWDCVVPNAGKWTVSLDGDNVKTFDITQNGDTHTLRLQYLYHDGVYNTSVTGDWKAVAKPPNANYPDLGATPTISDSSSGFTITQNKAWCYSIYYGQTKVDLTNYSTLVATVSSCTINSGGNAYFKIWSSIGAHSEANLVARQSITEVGKCTIDISDITGGQFVGFSTGNGETKNGQQPTEVTIERILCIGGA